MARTDWQYVNGTTNNTSVFFAGIRWRYRDDLFGTTGYPTDRVSSNTDIIEYQPFSGRKQSYNTFSYTSWKTSYYRYSYNTVSGNEPGTAENNLNVSTTFRFDKASNNTKYYPVKGSLSSANVFNISSDDTSRIIQVPHCSDGTSKVRLFFHYTGDSNTAFSYGETNAVITLETIPRASQIGVLDANIGSSTNITINKAVSSFTTTLYYKANGQSSFTKIVDKTSNQVYAWTVPTSFYNLIPNSKTISCQFYAETYNGSTLIGTSNTVTATFTTTGNPVINSSSAVDTNSTTVALTGNNANMVKYASNVQVSVNVSGQNSASVSSVTVNGSNVTLSGTNPKTGNITFNGATTNSFEIKVTDSRGYQTTTTKTMTKVDYVQLSINATIKRNQPTDGKVNISFSGNYYNGSFGSQNNSLTVQYRYKESTDSWTGHDWINTGISTSTSGNTYSGGTGNTPLSGFDYTKSYNFEIRATDKVGTKSITGITVTKGTPVYWWDNDEFNVNGKLGVTGTIKSSGNISTNNKSSATDGVAGTLLQSGSIEMSGSTPYIDFHYNNSTSDYTSRIIENESGQLQISGKAQIVNGIYSKPTGQVGTPVGNSCLIVKRANNTEAPNNGVVLEFGNSTSWTGQLFIGDNATQGIWYNGWSNGTRGNWVKLTPLLTETGTDTSPFDSVSTGSFVSLSYAKFGKMIEINMRFKSTSSVSAGSNAFVGVIKSAYRPKIDTTGSSYNAARGMIGNLETNGTLTVRVISGTLSNNVESGISFTYIV